MGLLHRVGNAAPAMIEGEIYPLAVIVIQQSSICVNSI